MWHPKNLYVTYPEEAEHVHPNFMCLPSNQLALSVHNEVHRACPATASTCGSALQTKFVCHSKGKADMKQDKHKVLTLHGMQLC